MASLQIGTYRVAEPTKFTQHYETAAWYRNIEVQPCEVPARLTLQEGRAEWIGATVKGKVVGSDFTSLFGGLRVGAGKVNEDVGEDAEYHVSARSYEVAAQMAKDPDRADGFKVDRTLVAFREHPFEGTKWDYDKKAYVPETRILYLMELTEKGRLAYERAQYDERVEQHNKESVRRVRSGYKALEPYPPFEPKPVAPVAPAATAAPAPSAPATKGPSR
jgi:hypothetical protein